MMVWLRVLGLPLLIAPTCNYDAWGKGKIELYMCAYRPIIRDPEEKKRGRKCDFDKP